MNPRYLLVLALVFFVFPAVHAGCPEPETGIYPGWQERFNGTVTKGTMLRVGDYDLKLLNIFTTTAAKFEVLKHSSKYMETTIWAGRERRLILDDYMVVLYRTSGTTQANVSIYTPRDSNVTMELLGIDFLKGSGGRNYTVPSEEFTIDLQLNNTGELGATGVKITPNFGGFTVLSEPSVQILNICPSDTYDLTYVLKAPFKTKRTNYTLYVDVEYSDTNVELKRSVQRKETLFFTVEIVPVTLEITRSVSNWSLGNPGRDVLVQILINNTGIENAYNVQWADTQTDMLVTSGKTSWSGTLYDGQTRRFPYRLISDDPIACLEVSRVTYEDKYGNEYTAYSDSQMTQFSPNITVTKKIGNKRWNIRDESPVILLNGTETVIVEITNEGNAFARDLLVKDTLGNAIVQNGTTFWKGDLPPGETVLYTYTVRGDNTCEQSIKTTVKYSTIDTRALNETFLDVEGECACFCTKTLEAVSFDSSEKVYAIFTKVNIEQESLKKVVSDCVFDFDVNVSAGASGSVYDVYTHVNFSNFLKAGGKILEGQEYHYEPELKAPYQYDCTTRRNWTPTNLTYNFTLASPNPENITNYPIIITVDYMDANGKQNKSYTVNINVVPTLGACRRVTVRKSDVEVTVDYANETTQERAGEFNIKLKNTGFADLENVSVVIKLPKDIESGTNDTRWLGRVEYEVKRVNDTLFIYSGKMEMNMSLNATQEVILPMQISGSKAGDYKIPYEIHYDEDKTVSGELDFRVKGAILEITKTLAKTEADSDEEIAIEITVKNIGDDMALDVKVQDFVPPYFDIRGTLVKNKPSLGPGESVIMEYLLRVSKEGSYPVDSAVVSWTDRLGNEYTTYSEASRLDIIESTGVIEDEVLPEERRAPSSTEFIATVLFSLIILGILFKILSMTRPMS